MTSGISPGAFTLGTRACDGAQSKLSTDSPRARRRSSTSSRSRSPPGKKRSTGQADDGQSSASDGELDIQLFDEIGAESASTIVETIGQPAARYTHDGTEHWLYPNAVKVSEGDFLNRDGTATAFTHRVDPSGRVLLRNVRAVAGGVAGDGLLAKVTFRAKDASAEAQIKLLSLVSLDANKQAQSSRPLSPSCRQDCWAVEFLASSLPVARHPVQC